MKLQYLLLDLSVTCRNLHVKCRLEDDCDEGITKQNSYPTVQLIPDDIVRSDLSKFQSIL